MMYERRSCADIPCPHLSPSVLLPFLFVLRRWSVPDTGDVQAFINGQNKNGIADGFDGQNGWSEKGLWGYPTRTGGNILHFSSTNSPTETIDGHSAITSDPLQLDIIAHPGKEVKGIHCVKKLI